MYFLRAPQSLIAAGRDLSEEEVAVLDDVLAGNFLFCHLNDSERHTVYGQTQRRDVVAGETIMTQASALAMR